MPARPRQRVPHRGESAHRRTGRSAQLASQADAPTTAKSFSPRRAGPAPTRPPCAAFLAGSRSLLPERGAALRQERAAPAPHTLRRRQGGQGRCTAAPRRAPSPLPAAPYPAHTCGAERGRERPTCPAAPGDGGARPPCESSGARGGARPRGGGAAPAASAAPRCGLGGSAEPSGQQKEPPAARPRPRHGSRTRGDARCPEPPPGLSAAPAQVRREGAAEESRRATGEPAGWGTGRPGSLTAPPGAGRAALPGPPESLGGRRGAPASPRRPGRAALTGGWSAVPRGAIAEGRGGGRVEREAFKWL